MEFLYVMGAIILAGISGTAFFFRKGGIYNPHEEPDNTPVQDFTDLPYLPPEVPVEPPTAPDKLLWGTPKHAYHSTRVLCDEMGLTLEQKNLLCACIYQESQFLNTAVGKNKNSTDWGIAQVNDTKGWHIGPGLRFPSVQYVKDHPEECVRWMAGVLKQTGKLQPWASYTSGAYKQWLTSASPMWLLK